MTEPNTMFPGRPDYTGPRSGVFGLLHHDQLCESSHDVMERVKYVKREKPKNEIAIRLHNMIYLGGCEAAIKREALYADYAAKHAPLYADYAAKREALYADYAAKHEELYAEHAAKRAPLYADYAAKREELYAEHAAKRAPLDAEIVAYIKQNIPDCAWDGRQLRF